MAVIRPPSWCKDAQPTTRGWVNPKTGELLKVVKIKQAMIDEFNDFHNTRTPIIMESEPEIITDETLFPKAFEDENIETNDEQLIEEKAEEDTSESEETSEEVQIEMPFDDLEDMTKKELEELGREHGVELDRREKKATLIEKMKNILG